MLQLTPLAIALQGIGFGALLTAAHGLVAEYVTPPPTPQPIDSPGAGGSSRQSSRPIHWIGTKTLWENYLAAVSAPALATQKKQARDDEELLCLLA